MWVALCAAVLIAGVPAAPAHAAAGGPDTGGYSYLDSTEPGGPAPGPFTSIIASKATPLVKGDDNVASVTLPFPISVYNDTATVITVSTNGVVELDTQADSFAGDALPQPDYGTSIFPFGADLVANGVYGRTTGTAPNRSYVLEWDAAAYGDPGAAADFQLVFAENGAGLVVNYLDVDPGIEHVVGMQGAGGIDGNLLQYDGATQDAATDLAVAFTRVPRNDAAHLTASPAGPVAYGRPTTLAASIVRTDGSAAVPTGSVAFSADGVALGTAPLDASGTATLTTSAPLDAGDHAVVASYAGDGTATPAEDARYVVIEQGAAQAAVALTDGSSIAAGTPVDALVSAVAPAAGTPTGTAYWFDDQSGFFATTALTEGRATLPGTALAPGSYTGLGIYYGGGVDFTSAFSGTVSVTVTPAVVRTRTRLTSTANPAPFRGAGSLVATVKPLVGRAVPTGTVTFLDDGVVVATVVLTSKGQAKLPLKRLAVGTHPMTARYDGDTNADADFRPSTSAELDQVIAP